MYNQHDNSNPNKENQNMIILATFQNIKFYDFQDGSLCDGFLIISKDPLSFYFRWEPYTSNRKKFTSSTNKQVQLISSILLFRVVIETSYQHCEVSLYCVDQDDPTIFRADQNHINFSHELAQIFTINSVFLGNPNWIHLTHMFLKPPTAETDSIIYYLPCYNGKFSFPVFLSDKFLQTFKKKIEKGSKKKDNDEVNDIKPTETTSQATNRPNPIKSFFNFAKFTNSSTTTTKPATTDSTNSFLSNFSQLLSKYKIKTTNHHLPMTKSDFMLLTSQNVSMQDIKKMIAYQGMDEELRSEMWPIFLSILPYREKSIQLDEIESTYQKVLKLRVEEYKSLKIQWSSLSPYQLFESKKLRSAFYTIKMDVKRTTLPDELVCHLRKTDETTVKKASILFKKVLKNILKTFSVWNQKIRYTQGINEIAVPFVCVSLYDIINTVIENSDENYGLTENFNENFSSSNLIVEKEAIAFWSFVSFQEKSQNVLLETSMTNLIEVDLPEILEIVKKQSNRDAFKFIKQYQLDSLNFIVSPFMLLFRRSFTEEKVERLWDTIIVLDKSAGGCSQNLIRKKNFELAFAASVILFVVPLLKKKFTGEQQISSDQLNEMLCIELPEIIESLPIEYVISVALQIENDLSLKNQPRILNCQQDLDENDLFTPALFSETNDYVKLGLFC